MFKELVIIIFVFWGQYNTSFIDEKPTGSVLSSFNSEIDVSVEIKNDKIAAIIKSEDKTNEINKDQFYSAPALSQISNPNYNHFKVGAKSAIAANMETGVILYEKNIQEKVPIASLTKLMTALIVLEKNELDSLTIISKNAIASEGDKGSLKVDEKITVKNLLYLLLVNSSNDAAVALAEHIAGSENEFVKLMNQKAEELGLNNTRFINTTGLDLNNKNNYSTAYDLVKLTKHALDKPLLCEIMRVQNLNVFSVDKQIKHRLKNTNKLLGKLPGINIISGKTGFTNKAGECLILAISHPDNNQKIVCVILNSEDRFGEMERLVNELTN